MQQLIAVLLAICILPLLLKRKIPVGGALLILGAMAGLIGGLGVAETAQCFLRVFTEWNTFSAVLVVIEIGMLSYLMTHYGILRMAEDAIKKLIHNASAITMILPALIGILQAPGGAALSAPFVNSMGEEMELTPVQRSNINVVCRHIALFLLPFSTNMIIVHTAAPTVDLIKLALYNLGFVILMQAAGWFFFLRKSKPVAFPPSTTKERLGAVGTLLLALSPIYVVILLNSWFGLSYNVALLVSILIVFLLSDKKDFPSQLVKSFSPVLSLMILGVYFFQNVVNSCDDLLGLFTNLLSSASQWGILGLIALVSTVFGLSTGLMYLPLGVLIPIVMKLPFASETAQMITLSFTFCWSFIGYYFSPIHLCQLLSDQAMGCEVGERYRAYLPFILCLAVFPFILYFLYRFLLL